MSLLNEKKALSRHTRTIAANDSVEIHGVGDFIYMYTDTSGNNLYFSLDDQSEVNLQEGWAIDLRGKGEFSKVRIRNASGSSCSLDIIIALGGVTNFASQITNTVTVRGGSSPSTPAAVSVSNVATSLFTSSATKTMRVIQNNGLTDLWIGDSNVDGSMSRGINLTPGASITLPITGQIYGRTVSGTTTASILEVSE